MKFPDMSQADVLAISKALADTDFGFTGIELGLLINQYGFVDTDPSMTKYKRLYNSFAERCQREKSYDSFRAVVFRCGKCWKHACNRTGD